jgi:hypothetical protein
MMTVLDRRPAQDLAFDALEGDVDQVISRLFKGTIMLLQRMLAKMVNPWSKVKKVPKASR